MNPSQLYTTSPMNQLHLLGAIAVFCLESAQLVITAGRLQHRLSGYIWIGILVVVALSNLFIHELPLWGPFSSIHLLSLFTLVTIFLAIQVERAGNIKW